MHIVRVVTRSPHLIVVHGDRAVIMLVVGLPLLVRIRIRVLRLVSGVCVWIRRRMIVILIVVRARLLILLPLMLLLLVLLLLMVVVVVVLLLLHHEAGGSRGCERLSRGTGRVEAVVVLIHFCCSVSGGRRRGGHMRVICLYANELPE